MWIHVFEIMYLDSCVWFHVFEFMYLNSFEFICFMFDFFQTNRPARRLVCDFQKFQKFSALH